MTFTLVDGYNLLHASGVFGRLRGPRGLESSRTALLDHVADLVGETAPRVLFVFDAANAPDGLPGRITHRGIRVWFAREYPDADSLIEEILEEERSPASITVVSNDRRLQLAARRRRAPCGRVAGGRDKAAGAPSAAHAPAPSRAQRAQATTATKASPTTSRIARPNGDTDTPRRSHDVQGPCLGGQ